MSEEKKTITIPIKCSTVKEQIMYARVAAVLTMAFAIVYEIAFFIVALVHLASGSGFELETIVYQSFWLAVVMCIAFVIIKEIDARYQIKCIKDDENE